MFVTSFRYNDYEDKCGAKNGAKGSERYIRMSDFRFRIYLICKHLIIRYLYLFILLTNDVLSNKIGCPNIQIWMFGQLDKLKNSDF